MSTTTKTTFFCSNQIAELVSVSLTLDNIQMISLVAVWLLLPFWIYGHEIHPLIPSTSLFFVWILLTREKHGMRILTVGLDKLGEDWDKVGNMSKAYLEYVGGMLRASSAHVGSNLGACWKNDRQVKTKLFESELRYTRKGVDDSRKERCGTHWIRVSQSTLSQIFLQVPERDHMLLAL